MDRGLWRYTRHPNYFGELCQWWGLLIMVTTISPWALLGTPGVAIYSWLIVNVTGKTTLEKKMAKEKPDFAEYRARTNGLIPWRPHSRE